MNFQELINQVRDIPYGRNSNRYDFSLVITENKGTCSSKHAFLKDYADKNGIPNVKLMIGIYKMNESNTNIRTILSENNLEYIPEAHCYLKIDGTVIEAPAGPVGVPGVDKQANITLTTFFEGQVTFHSHPSGVRIDGNTTKFWAYPPSFKGADIQNFNNNREYVFGRSSGTVYIYNSNGVMATIPQQYFVTGKK